MKSQRFILLDGLRGLAAIGIVFHHVGQTFYKPLAGLYLLVDFFFVLSGFVLLPMLPGQHEPLVPASKIFVWRRFLRFWPMVIVVILFRLILWGLWELRGQPETLAGKSAAIQHWPTSFVTALLLLHIIYPLAREWTGVLWSLSAEWWANLLAIPFVASVRRWMLPAGLVLSYLVLLTGWLLNQQAIEGIRSLGRAMVGFFIGLILRRWYDNRDTAFSPLMFSSSLVVVIGYFIFESFVKTGELIIAGPLFAFFIFQVATIDQEKLNRSFLRICTFLGAMSFGIYAWHPNMQMLLSVMSVKAIAKSNVEESVWYLLISGSLIITLSIVASLLVQRFLDRPIQSKYVHRKVTRN